MGDTMRLAIVTKVPIKLSEKLSGQKYYLRIMIETLKTLGVDVELVSLQHFIKERKQYDSVHAYYLGFKDLIRLHKSCIDKDLTYYVFHIDDVTWKRTHAYAWKVFLISLQAFIDRYLVTSRSVYYWLRAKTYRQVILVEPYYECSCKTFNDFIKVIRKKFSDNNKKLRLLYIGRLHPLRFNFREMVDVMKKLGSFLRNYNISVDLTVVSKIDINIRSFNYKSGNVVVTFINKELSDAEKCLLYRTSHFFLFPTQGNTAMNPPITLLEAVYHGCIPIVTSHVLRDLKIPQQLVMKNPNTLPHIIFELFMNHTMLKSIILELYKYFSEYYDISKFVDALKRVI